jgi:hypothetical protein
MGEEPLRFCAFALLRFSLLRFCASTSSALLRFWASPFLRFCASALLPLLRFCASGVPPLLRSAPLRFCASVPIGVGGAKSVFVFVAVLLKCTGGAHTLATTPSGDCLLCFTALAFAVLGFGVGPGDQATMGEEPLRFCAFALLRFSLLRFCASTSSALLRFWASPFLRFCASALLPLLRFCASGVPPLLRSAPLRFCASVPIGVGGAKSVFVFVAVLLKCTGGAHTLATTPSGDCLLCFTALAFAVLGFRVGPGDQAKMGE